MAHRVLYYTLDGDTAAANEILAEMGMQDQIELVGCAHRAAIPAVPEQFCGCEGIIGEFSPVPAETADAMAAAGMRVVASMSIGINHLDMERLRAHGIYVGNCPAYCAEDVAGHTVGLMLDLMHKISFTSRDVLAGNWDPKFGYETYRTQGSCLGLVFFGNIAQKVAPVARALGMRVLVYAPTKSAAELAGAGCEKAETLDELLRACDVLSLHCPLIPETERIIDAHAFEIMKPTAYLVNTARGACVDEDALLVALNENIASGGTRGIRAAGLDVLADEVNPNYALVQHERVVVTPHTSYDSRESAENLRRMSLENVCDVLVRNKSPRHEVRP